MACFLFAFQMKGHENEIEQGCILVMSMFVLWALLIDAVRIFQTFRW